MAIKVPLWATGKAENPGQQDGFYKFCEIYVIIASYSDNTYPRRWWDVNPQWSGL